MRKAEAKIQLNEITYRS